MSNKPILYTLIAAGMFVTVSAPLAFIVGVFVIYATGVITAGIIAGAITTVVFVSWASGTIPARPRPTWGCSTSWPATWRRPSRAASPSRW
ncbi:MAG: hypothetical protein BRD21_05670 [Halobacteriales archaeon SW_8_66_22]|nr:MAG: hypothetical protein BRD21_05670 [Halobacteriales archaeon SW_8_66_22]